MTIGTALHAGGHAVLAGAAGLLVRSFDKSHGLGMDIGSSGRFSTASLGSLTVALAGVGVAAAILKLVGGALAASAEARVAGSVASDVRLEALDLVLRTRAVVVPVGHPDQGAAPDARGARLAALTTHIHDVERGVSHGVLAELRAAVQLAPLLVLLIALAPKLAASALLALAAFGVFAFLMRRAFKRARARAGASAEALAAAADEAVRHADLWTTYGAESRLRAHVVAIGRAIGRESGRLRVRAAMLSATSEVLGALALVLALLFARTGGLGDDPGRVLPFAIVFFMAYRPLRELIDARVARARGDEALRAALAISGHVAHAATPRERRSWPPAPLVLKQVVGPHGTHVPLSLVVPEGEIVAIVGATGTGKTSLFRALLGLERARDGSVRYGDAPLDDAGIGPGARPFAWVPQEAPILGDSLAANVGLGAPVEIDHEAAAALLAELGAGDLARDLDQAALGTTRPLSGGERQLVAVARALATNLPVLLLDEPTSALDEASEARVLAALARLRGKRTVLLATHRPAPLAIADRVVRLEPRFATHVEDGSPSARRRRRSLGAPAGASVDGPA